MNDMMLLDAHKHTSCGYHRIWMPFLQADFKPQLKVPVYIFNRVPVNGFKEIAQRRKEGYKIIADVDDFWMLPKSHYLYHQFNGRYGQSIRDSIAAADMVFTTNDYLATHVRPLNKKIVMVPNALPYGVGQFAPSKSSMRNTTFVYAAGPSHRADVDLIRTAINCHDVAIAGYNDRSPEWHRIKAIAPQAQYIQEKPVNQYMTIYHGHRAALAPLVSNPFNACKSNLKVLEAGCAGIPIVASEVHPYMNPRDKDVVLYAKTDAEFQAHMNRIRTDVVFAQEMGNNLAEHVREHYHLASANLTRRHVLESFS